MRKILIIAIAFFSVAAFAAHGKCDFDKAIVAFEKRMDVQKVMKGAERAFFPYEEAGENSGMVRMRSKPIKSGRYMGLVRSEAYYFVNCMLVHVIVTYWKLENKEIVQQATAYLREDGNLRAICSGKSNVTVENPIDGTISPNPECSCFNKNSIERPFGKYGCLEDWQIEEMNEHNSGASPSLLEQIRRGNAKIE